MPAADLAGRPDLIERNFTADAAARKLVGNITHTPLTQEGFVYPAGRDETTLLEKNCWLAEHMRTELVQNALQNWRFGSASPSRV